MRRVEKRYLITDVGPIADACHCSGMAYKSYLVDTEYLDHNPPTWSVGDGPKKYRMRWYDGNNEDTYFEIKIRKRDDVTKRRRKSKPDQWHGLHEVAWVQYFRHEFTGDGFRVTIDDGVMTMKRALPYSVVEIKKTKDVDTRWLEQLLPAEEREFSKSKWVLGHWIVK